MNYSELLELLFRSSDVTIFEHLEPLFEPNPHYWDHFQGPKTGGTEGHTDNGRTDIHTSIFEGVYTIGPVGNNQREYSARVCSDNKAP